MKKHIYGLEAAEDTGNCSSWNQAVVLGIMRDPRRKPYWMRMSSL